MPNKTYKTYKRKKQSGKSSKVQVGGWVCDKYKKQLKELHISIAKEKRPARNATQSVAGGKNR